MTERFEFFCPNVNQIISYESLNVINELSMTELYLCA